MADVQKEKVEKLIAEDVDLELLKNIRCTSCSNYFFPPIYLCPKGHNLCNDCIQKFKFTASSIEAPVFGSGPVFGATTSGLYASSNSSSFVSSFSQNNSRPFQSTSGVQNEAKEQQTINSATPNNCYCFKCNNFFPKVEERRSIAREKSIQILNFPCGNIKNGCEYRNNLFAVKEHEQMCSYSKRSCFFKNCAWEGTTKDIMIHIKELHNLITLNKIENLTEGTNILPFVFDSQLFIFKTIYNLCGSIEFVVFTTSETNKYLFEIYFLGYHKGVNIAMTNFCEPLLSNVKTDDVPVDKYLSVPFSLLKNFLTDFEQIKFKINVVKINE